MPSVPMSRAPGAKPSGPSELWGPTVFVWDCDVPEVCSPMGLPGVCLCVCVSVCVCVCVCGRGLFSACEATLPVCSCRINLFISDTLSPKVHTHTLTLTLTHAYTHTGCTRTPTHCKREGRACEDDCNPPFLNKNCRRSILKHRGVQLPSVK